jgi:perosamine synthetase
LESKRELYRRYELAFSEVNEVQLIKEPNECQSNYWLQTLRLRSPDLKIRDEILDILNSAGFMSRPGWDVITSLKPFETNPSMILETANNIFNSVINIPSILKKSMQK